MATKLKRGTALRFELVAPDENGVTTPVIIDGQEAQFNDEAEAFAVLEDDADLLKIGAEVRPVFKRKYRRAKAHANGTVAAIGDEGGAPSFGDALEGDVVAEAEAITKNAAARVKV